MIAADLERGEICVHCTWADVLLERHKAVRLDCWTLIGDERLFLHDPDTALTADVGDSSIVVAFLAPADVVARLEAIADNHLEPRTR